MLSRVFEGKKKKKNGRVIELIRDWNLIPLSSLSSVNERRREGEGTAKNSANGRYIMLLVLIIIASHGKKSYVIERRRRRKKRR